MIVPYLAVFLYSCLVKIALPFAGLVSLFSDSVKYQLEGRKAAKSIEARINLAALRRVRERCVVFFCSSAGEYEQAKPVISRLEADDVFCHVFFFSRSGFTFAKARGEKISYSLAPDDCWWTWGGLLSALRPNAAVIIRHEFWPGFMTATSRRCPVFVLDAVLPSMMGREWAFKTRFSAAWKAWLFRFCGVRACTVDASATEYFTKQLQVPREFIFEIGDTKYDRVVERVAGLRETAAERILRMRKMWKGPFPMLVIGSAHQPDVEIILSALALHEAPKLRLVVVPHDLSSNNIVAISNQLREAGKKVESIEDIELLLIDDKSFDCDAVLVDSMGHLSELYGLADLAFVGGAVHAKIHNVLEPAAWGIPITCGMKIDNSQEARLLRDAGLITPSPSPQSLAGTWKQQLLDSKLLERQMQETLCEFAGSSDRFIAVLNEFLRKEAALHA